MKELEARLLPMHPLLPLFTTHDEAAAMPTLREPETAREGGMPVASWTLQTLTGSPQSRTPSPSILKLQLRLPE